MPSHHVGFFTKSTFRLVIFLPLSGHIGIRYMIITNQSKEKCVNYLVKYTVLKNGAIELKRSGIIVLNMNFT